MTRKTVSGRTYRRTRPRGFAPWDPKPATRRLVNEVLQILEEYREHLPMTARQVFYRLVGAHDYPKDERAYERLCEAINRARRARMIPMSAIRDDRAEAMGGDYGGFEGPAEFWSSVRSMARTYTRPLTVEQPQAVEVWAEAAGMLPMIAKVTQEYGVTVYSSGGFESVGAKYQAAARIAYRRVPTVVLSVGDLDPSGLSMVDAAAEDIVAFATELGTVAPPTVSRLAVTPEQVRQYGLVTAPQKRTDRRGDHMNETVQAEALSPDELTGIVRAGIEEAIDLDVLAEARARAERERAELLADVERLLGSE